MEDGADQRCALRREVDEELLCGVDVGIGDVQQPLSETSVDDFLQPIMTAMRTQFLTTRAAIRHMVGGGSGVILAFGGGGESTLPGLGGFKVALDAIEGHRRQWACELGPHGIRVVTLKSGGVPETLPEGFPGGEAIVASLEEAALLHRTLGSAFCLFQQAERR